MGKEILVKAINFKVNIFNPAWIDMVFEGKNQAYGAYSIRKESPQRHLVALFIASALFVGAIVGPGLLKRVMPDNGAIEMSRPYEFTTIIETPVNKVKEIIYDTPKPQYRKTIKNTPPVIVPDDKVDENQEQMKTQQELNNSNAVIAAVEVENGSDNYDAPIATSSVITEETGADVYIVEIMPEFPGGQTELLRYISKNVRYPIIAQELGIQGVVYLKFVIGKDGRVTRVSITRGLHSSCDQEAIRVIESMPTWKPGRQGGQEVAVSYTIPIKFKLNN
jgi:periplasmic protein TonB